MNPEQLTPDQQQPTQAEPPAQPAVQQLVTQGVPASPPKSGKAITALVLGIISLLTWPLTFLTIAIPIAGIVIGIIARKSVKRGMAVAGIILSSIGLIMSIVMLSIGVALLNGGPIFGLKQLSSTSTNIFTFNYRNEDANFNLIDYTDQENKVSFKIPEGWIKLDSAKIQSSDQLIASENDKDYTLDGSSEAISVACKDYSSGPPSNKAFYDEIESKLTVAAKELDPQHFKGIHSKKRTIINGYPVYQQVEEYSSLVGVRAAAGGRGDVVGTTFYHSYYLVGPKRVCSLYLRAVLYTPSYSQPSPLMDRADEIFGSFKSET